MLKKICTAFQQQQQLDMSSNQSLSIEFDFTFSISRSRIIFRFAMYWRLFRGGFAYYNVRRPATRSNSFIHFIHLRQSNVSHCSPLQIKKKYDGTIIRHQNMIDIWQLIFILFYWQVLTKDSVTVSVDAVVYYRIWLPTIAVANVYDYGNATRLLTSTTLRNILGTRTLAEILSQRENISLAVRTILDEVTKVWGTWLTPFLFIYWSYDW